MTPRRLVQASLVLLGAHSLLMGGLPLVVDLGILQAGAGDVIEASFYRNDAVESGLMALFGVILIAAAGRLAALAASAGTPAGRRGWMRAALGPCLVATLAWRSSYLLAAYTAPIHWGAELLSDPPVFYPATLPHAVVAVLGIALLVRVRTRRGTEGDRVRGSDTDLLQTGLVILGTILLLGAVAQGLPAAVARAAGGSVSPQDPGGMLAFGLAFVQGACGILLVRLAPRIALRVMPPRSPTSRGEPLSTDAVSHFAHGLVGFMLLLGGATELAREVFARLHGGPDGNAHPAALWSGGAAVLVSLLILIGPACIVRTLRGLPTRSTPPSPEVGSARGLLWAGVLGLGVWFLVDGLGSLAQQLPQWPMQHLFQDPALAYALGVLAGGAGLVIVALAKRASARPWDRVLRVTLGLLVLATALSGMEQVARRLTGSPTSYGGAWDWVKVLFQHEQRFTLQLTVGLLLLGWPYLKAGWKRVAKTFGPAPGNADQAA